MPLIASRRRESAPASSRYALARPTLRSTFGTVLAAIFLLWLPTVSHAVVEASFTSRLTGWVTVEAPGGSIEVFSSDFFTDSTETGTGTVTSSFALPTTGPSEGTAEVSGTASAPSGDAWAGFIGSLFLDVIAPGTGPITATVRWNFTAFAEAMRTGDPLMRADAAAFAEAILFVGDGGPATAFAFAESDALLGPSGPQSQSVDGSLSFEVAAGQFVPVDITIEGSGSASVAPIPLPAPALLFGSALLALGAFRRAAARRRT